MIQDEKHYIINDVPAKGTWLDSNQAFRSHFQFRETIDDYKQGGEGNGNPLQYSCLENPMGGGAW